jgi:hypothetical protein
MLCCLFHSGDRRMGIDPERLAEALYATLDSWTYEDAPGFSHFCTSRDGKGHRLVVDIDCYGLDLRKLAKQALDRMEGRE